jgi:DNA polymerase Ligase (LigD)
MSPNRFVILHHLAPTGEHWDLMLEQEDVLVTWQLLSEPIGRDACPIRCVRIDDHRKRYLDYEGPIGGGRGIVTRFDRGDYELLAVDDARWTLRLAGGRMTGEFCIERDADGGRHDYWLVAP